MKNFAVFCLFLVLSLPAVALDNGRVMYVGGTVPGVSARTIGRLDTTSETALVFEYSGSKLEIPYAAIQSFDYSKEVTRHIGVLPAIAVRLLMVRQRRHFFRISYHDPKNVTQAIVLEVPKTMPRTLQAVLETRAPGSSRPYLPCYGKN
jgi:hypothetical protein